MTTARPPGTLHGATHTGHCDTSGVGAMRLDAARCYTSAAMVQPFGITDKQLIPVAQKLLAGHRLDLDDGLLLQDSRDIHAIGAMAHQVRTRLHGKTVFYNRNRHINYTNVCARGL
jgi:hypothetical protein